MRVLLDECIDERFRHELPDLDCQTAGYAGFSGTVDQNIAYQQNRQNRAIAIIVLRTPTNRLLHLKRVITPMLDTLSKLKHGEIVIVSSTATGS